MIQRGAPRVVGLQGSQRIVPLRAVVRLGVRGPILLETALLIVRPGRCIRNSKQSE